MIEKKTISTILKEKGIINQAQAKEVQLLHLETGKSEEEILLEKKLASKEEITKAKAELYGVPFVDLEKVGFSPVSISYVPRSVAERYKLIPFDVDQKEKKLLVAMANPLDLETIEFLEKKTEMKVVPHMALPEQIEKMIKERYEQELTTQVTQALKETEKKKTIPDLDHLDEVIREAPIAKIVSTCLLYTSPSPRD